jgi:predicted TIM-barrel fold metal-dependent hydrolase
VTLPTSRRADGGAAPSVVDVHHHLLGGETHYEDTLIRAMDDVGIDWACLNGLGIKSNNWLGDLSPGNDDVEHAVRRHHDRLVGFGTIRLGVDPPSRIRQLADRGFRGLKTTRPLQDYDHPSFDEHWALAQDVSLPVLVHTGFIITSPADRHDDVSSARCRPVLLDRVARTFPDLVLILAHLGHPWYDEAAQMARYHSNVYVDLSGARDGWRSSRPASWFAQVLWWPDAFNKVVFGTDVHHRDVNAVYADYITILRENDVPARIRNRVMGGTVARLLRLPGRLS